MKDIPIFTEAGGVSTLILREIPYKRSAFVLVRFCPKETLAEHLSGCKGFCRACGAETVFAGAEDEPLLPEAEPAYSIDQWRGKTLCTAPEEPELVPLDEDNKSVYADIYNRCFAGFPSAATRTEKGMIELLESPTRRGYLAVSGGKPIGCGETEGQLLKAICVAPESRGGTGTALLRRLMALLHEQGHEEMLLKVMSTNLSAISMYKKSGFVRDKTISRWYRL